MTKEPILVIMAAGMGSRYGGLKQIEKMTDTGEIILDFSLYDAMMAGFKKVVFVIREEHREHFRQMVDERAGRFLQIEYAYQKLDDIPEGVEIPEGRVKPWGTGHAILACRELIDGPFLVINADDYYGPAGYAAIYDFLVSHDEEAQKQAGAPMELCMAGYILGNTVTENGQVSRGVCEMDEKGYLTKITERTRIVRRPEGIAYTEDRGETWTALPDDALVSMNFWGLPGGMIDVLKEEGKKFFEEDMPKNPLKGEYLLPAVIDEMIQRGRARVQVIPCHEKWCGVTYKEDTETVKAELQSKKDKGLYPDRLWK